MKDFFKFKGLINTEIDKHQFKLSEQTARIDRLDRAIIEGETYPMQTNSTKPTYHVAHT